MYYDTQDNVYKEKPKRSFIVLMAFLLIISAAIGGFFSYLIFVFKEPERVPGRIIQKTAVDYNVADDAEAIIARNNLMSIVSIEVQGGSSQYSGTGFIADYVENEDALNPIIMTNYHVVKEAIRFSKYKIYIKLFDKAAFFKTEAEVIGYDSQIDIAVLKLKIDLQDVQNRIVQFGNSRLLRYGQRAVAIGNALGGGLSVTSGEISIPEVVQLLQLSENEDANNSVQHLIQTGAAINSGNSGGVLLNMSGNGEVIGVNTYKVTAQTISLDYNQSIKIPADNVGLAVPSNMAVAILDYIKANTDGYEYKIGNIKDVRKNFVLNLENITASMDENYNNVLVITGINGWKGKIITKINGIDINEFHQGMYVPSASIFQELCLYYGNTPSDLSDNPFYRLTLTFSDEETHTISGLYLQREIPWLDELINT
jgi:S1-C subfamily serine protease